MQHDVINYCQLVSVEIELLEVFDAVEKTDRKSCESVVTEAHAHQPVHVVEEVGRKL